VKYANAKLDQHRKQANSLQESIDQVLNKLSSSDARIAQLTAEGIGDWGSFYSEMLRKATEATQ
ncbi:hypothetical protein ElyMa_003276100, partial [Elysia marginata]